MKLIPDFLKRKPKSDPTNPTSMEPAKAAPKAAGKPGFLTGLKQRVFGKKETSGPAAPEAGQADNLSALESMKQKLGDLVGKKNGKHTRNTILIIAGGGLAIAGMAADLVFLGGMGTATVAAMIYSDWRNKQHIDKISSEIGKIDTKIEELKKAQQPLPDYGPALSAMKSSIEDFQASAKKLPPDVVENLDKLKNQVSALQEKITPANDDNAPKPATPAVGA